MQACRAACRAGLAGRDALIRGPCRRSWCGRQLYGNDGTPAGGWASPDGGSIGGLTVAVVHVKKVAPLGGAALDEAKLRGGGPERAAGGRVHTGKRLRGPGSGGRSTPSSQRAPVPVQLAPQAGLPSSLAKEAQEPPASSSLPPTTHATHTHTPSPGATPPAPRAAPHSPAPQRCAAARAAACRRPCCAAGRTEGWPARWADGRCWGAARGWGRRRARRRPRAAARRLVAWGLALGCS